MRQTFSANAKRDKFQQKLFNLALGKGTLTWKNKNHNQKLKKNKKCF